jgi:hypothetical protein
MGYILSSAPNESGAIDSYWDGDEWQPLLNNALFFSQASGVTVELMRQTEGDYQQRYTDRDVRMLPAQQTIALI